MVELPIGSVFGGHRVEAVVGRGGMGVVYVAMHERLKQQRALKVIAPEFCRDEEFRRRFEREWEAAAAIDHPHVIPIYDAGEDQAQLYIAMRYVDGLDMRNLIAREGRLDPRVTAEIVGQIAAALDAAHGRGLVHRDVKPANILITWARGAPFSYLTDFGLTKRVNAETAGLTKTGLFVGTLDYIAPEQLEGVATFRSDIYALGCLTYHALSGHVPYPQPSAPAKMWAHINAQPPHLTDGSPQLAEVVARAMAKNPDERFAAAGEFAQALDAALHTSTLPAEVRPSGDGTLHTDIDSATVSEESPAFAGPRIDAEEAPAAPSRPAGRPAARSARPLRRRPVAAAIALVVVLSSGVAAAVISSGNGGRTHSETSGDAGNAPAGGVKLAVHPVHPVPTPKENIADAAVRLQRDHRSQGFTAVGWKRFGTGGIVEYRTSGRDEIANYPMALDPGGRFVPTDDQYSVYQTIGQERRDFAGPDAVARKFVRAVRAGHCAVFSDLYDTGGKSRKPGCDRHLDKEYSGAESDFQAAEQVDVFRLGGTANLCFYGVRARGTYRTLTVEEPPREAHLTGGPLVISMFPKAHGLPVKPESHD